MGLSPDDKILFIVNAAKRISGTRVMGVQRSEDSYGQTAPIEMKFAWLQGGYAAIPPAFESWRVRLSQLFVGGIFLLDLFSKSEWQSWPWITEACLVCGCLFAASGALGRAWCLAHIAGRKNVELVTTGPYSLCRHPLYFFSALGSVGAALASNTLSLPALVALAFASYYPTVIKSEERRLLEIHGQTFLDYRAKTPAFLPCPKCMRSGESVALNLRMFQNGLRDCIWFMLAFVGVHIISQLHQLGFGAVLFRLP